MYLRNVGNTVHTQRPKFRIGTGSEPLWKAEVGECKWGGGGLTNTRKIEPAYKIAQSSAASHKPIPSLPPVRVIGLWYCETSLSMREMKYLYNGVAPSHISTDGLSPWGLPFITLHFRPYWHLWDSNHANRGVKNMCNVIIDNLMRVILTRPVYCIILSVILLNGFLAHSLILKMKAIFSSETYYTQPHPISFFFINCYKFYSSLASISNEILFTKQEWSLMACRIEVTAQRSALGPSNGRTSHSEFVSLGTGTSIWNWNEVTGFTIFCGDCDEVQVLRKTDEDTLQQCKY
jgi:hypothetical protein